MGTVALDNLVGNSVHVLESLLGESLTLAVLGTIFLVLHNELGDKVGLGHAFENVSDVLTGSVSGVLLASTVSGTTTVMFTHAHGSDLLSHVELVHDGSSSGVEPVGIIRGEFLPASSLDMAGPLLN